MSQKNQKRKKIDVKKSQKNFQGTGLFRKKYREKHLCSHDNNYYFFWKSNIPVISLIVDSRNMVKVSKNMSL